MNRLLLLPLAWAGCTDFRDCSDVDTSLALQLPDTLDGVVSDDASPSGDGWISFEPRFPLWTDAAEKRRWIRIPAGSTIDTSDPDRWQFPIGTEALKEFTRDGVRVETRVLTNTPRGWAGSAYAWDVGSQHAARAPGGRRDVLETPHDVPSAGECMACHGGRESVILGFSATQLDGEVLAQLLEQRLITDPVSRVEPAGEGLAGLGVLHANCAHCHNPDRDTLSTATPCYRPDTSFDLTLPAMVADTAEAPAVQTAHRALGEVEDSRILDRMGSRSTSGLSPGMPPLGTEELDLQGIAAVEALVRSIQ